MAQLELRLTLRLGAAFVVLGAALGLLIKL